MDLYLHLATQIQNFFKYDLISLPLSMQEKIVRIEVPIPNLDPLQWLGQQQSDIKTYWSDRQGNFTMAGIGTLDLIAGDKSIDHRTIFGQLRQHLSPLFPQVRYYGGVGFRQDLSIDPDWELFGNYRFIIPRFEICTDGINTGFACNFLCDFNPEKLDLILDELAQINFILAENSIPLPLQVKRDDTPNRIEWEHNIEAALAQFTELNLDKIVLARRSILTFTQDIQPQLLLQSLQPNNAHSYHFCFQINPTTAFIGTSPERLYYRQDRFLQTEAIAGTRQRGTSPQLDLELSEDLRNSPKDLHEHQLVVNNLQAILAELCDSVTIESPGEMALRQRELTILKLNKVQHLYTQCHGTLAANLTDADILPKLHPTPAVGGFPRDQALKLIQELEPFERGWYAAPVGWVGYDDAEFAVAIRSGLIDRNRLLLFAGAGIVRGSQPEEEWAEIENKIRHFTDLFTDLPEHSTAIKIAAQNVKSAFSAKADAIANGRLNE
jgi:menaquinone-specific isochorismate synthase